MVSADLPHPDLRPYFLTRAESGLTNVLSGEIGAIDALTRAGDELYLLDVGSAWPIGTELLGSPTMSKAIADLESFADVVLIDASSVLESADALAIAPIADATLIVVDAERVTLADITQARYQLEHVGANVIGALLNNVDRSRFRPHAIGHSAGDGPALPPAANWSA
jgi:Mrp family chromosome partitioning ATPase